MENSVFSGKTLLVLGTNVGSVEIVEYARQNGAKTIVADYFPKEKSRAKQIADESVLISTADTSALNQLIKDRKIDAVLAGVSEFNLIQAMKLSQMNNLRFYCSKQQWDSIECKNQFRQLCISYGIPCPNTYKVSDNIHYPVIIKPDDSSSSIGITICIDKSQIVDAIKEAKEHSTSGNIIIEEYIEGEEFTAHYSIVDGRATLSSIDNRYSVSLSDKDTLTLPIARIYPSSFTQEYLEKINDKVICLCNSLGIEVGVLFVQGIYSKKTKSFYIFEGGLRCAGESPYRFTSRVNSVNSLHNYVDFALTGKVLNYDYTKEDPMFLGTTCGIISIASKGGVILNRIDGIKKVTSTLPQLIDYECRYNIGDKLPTGNTLRQIILRFALICNSRRELDDCINTINSNVFIYDDNGNDISIKFESF